MPIRKSGADKGVARREVGSAADAESPALSQQAHSSLELADDVLENPEMWLRTPNPILGGRKPIDLIRTDEEYRVYNLLNAVDQGLF